MSTQQDNMLTMPSSTFKRRIIPLLKSYSHKNELDESINFLNYFKQKHKKNKIHHGAFYKCRMLGIVTTFDQELHNHTNICCLMTLLYSAMFPKVLSTCMVKLKYWDKKYEIAYIFLGITISSLSAIVFCYKKKSKLDKMLDEKYTEIYEVAASKISS